MQSCFGPTLPTKRNEGGEASKHTNVAPPYNSVSEGWAIQLPVGWSHESGFLSSSGCLLDGPGRRLNPNSSLAEELSALPLDLLDVWGPAVSCIGLETAG